MKVIGYLISLIGVLLIISSISAFNAIFIKYLPFLATIDSFYLMIAGGIVLIIGVVFIGKSGGGKQAQEVPIYHGKSVVGYRRH
jgi:hypothetical protein